MRLFIAIEFPDDIKDALMRGTEQVRQSFERGSFPRKKNYHLTLVFLGETAPDRVPQVIEAIQAVTAPPLDMTIGHLGRFHSRSGDILCRAVETDSALYHLQRALSEELAARGFVLEDRVYTPHLTIARRAVLREGVTLRQLSEQLPPLAYTAREITLLSSEQVRGMRVYTPIFRRALE